MTSSIGGFRVGVAAVAIATLALVPAASAGKGHGSTNSLSSSCTPTAPAVTVDNNYAWGTPGSWGLPGQQLGYAVHVINYDVGCGSSSFAVSVAAPTGFAVSLPTSTITLNSSSSGYLWAYVTSPVPSSDGDYALAFSVQRTGATTSSTQAASSVNYYKIYSSDTTPPTLFWSDPSNGQTISGNSYMFTVSSSDDHAVKKIDLSIDGKPATTTTCSDVSYTCQLSYKWSLSHARGSHTATFTSVDWMGNINVLTVAFTVSK